MIAQLLSRKVAAGEAAVKLKLTPRGRAALKRHRRLKVTLTLTYQAPGTTRAHRAQAQADAQAVRCRAITRRCTSWVPS